MTPKAFAALLLGVVLIAGVVVAAVPSRSPAVPALDLPAPVVGPVGQSNPFPDPPGCELAWRSEQTTGWCRPKIEARACPGGIVWLAAREPRAGGSCMVVSEFFPECHPDVAAWACPNGAPDGR